MCVKNGNQLGVFGEVAAVLSPMLVWVAVKDESRNSTSVDTVWYKVCFTAKYFFLIFLGHKDMEDVSEKKSNSNQSLH